MKQTLPDIVTAGRVRHGPWRSDPSDGANGAFFIMGPKGAKLRIIVSDGYDPVAREWEHASVSVNQTNRCPNWPEMCFVKDLFWDPDEAVIQFHPPRSEYVNYHPTTLHLWRSRNPENQPTLPPSILVGPKGRSTENLQEF